MDQKRLQQGELEAWTYLLRREDRLREVQVIDVETQPLSGQESRFLLTLSGQEEPIALIGRETNAIEALFYQCFGDSLSSLVPRCWLAVEDPLTGAGWVVLEDYNHHHPPRTWDLKDVERLGGALAQLHATFWGMSRSGAAWLPVRPELPLNGGEVPDAADLFDPFYRAGDRAFSRSLLSPSPAERASLVSRLASPAQLTALHRQKPDLLSAADVTTILAVLDHPELMLRPLLALPFTLLHGSPIIANWRLTLFDECYLLNWRHAAAGPAALDLAPLLSHILILHKTIALGEGLSNSEIEELLVDSYIVRLTQELHERFGYGVSYSSKHFRRRALPAAQCWHLLQHLWRENPADPGAASKLKTLLPVLINACRRLTTG